MLCGGSRALALLLLLNLAASLILWIAGAVAGLTGLDAQAVSSFLSLPSSLPALLRRPWTLLTYMVVQTSPLHLLFNMLWLYCFGRMLADVAADRIILWLYVGGGLCGAILYLAACAATGASSVLVGSSAAVLALTMAAAVKMPSRRISLFLFGEVKLKWVALAAVALCIIGTPSLPSQAAHLGGIIFGAAWFPLRRRRPSRGKAFSSSKASSPFPRGRRGSGSQASGEKNSALSVMKRKPKIKVKSAIKAMEKNQPDEERLDALLDKIRVSGYESLSQQEKNELHHISALLQKEEN